jgi:hypothetical protein
LSGFITHGYKGDRDMDLKLTDKWARKMGIDVTNLAHLEEYEQMGWDVSEWKPAALEKAGRQVAQQATVAADRQAAREAFERANPVDISRLTPYIITPRDAGSEFVSDVVGKVMMGKEKKCKAMAQAPLVYAAVVQANNALWDPGNGSALPAVFVIALDNMHKNNIEWLRETAQAIAELKRGGGEQADMKKLIETLRNDISRFCFRIGPSVAGNADAWCASFTFDKQSDLPGSRIPIDGVLPFLLTDQPKENQFIPLTLVPAKYYS